MNNFEFYAVAFNNISLFLCLLFFSFLVHYVMFRTQVKSIFDPYFLAVISSVFCFTVVLILVFTRNMSIHLFFSYVLTQLSFILGLYSFRERNVHNLTRRIQPKGSKYANLIAFYFFSIIYLVCQCTIYFLKGIPLFMESRLETFSGGGGVGILGRVSDVSSVFSLYAFYLVVKIDKFRLTEVFKYLTLLLISITFLLSGSKSSFLMVLFVFWCFIVFAKIKGDNVSFYIEFLKNNSRPIVLCGLVIVSFIIFVQSKPNDLDGNTLNPILALSLRFIHSGDVYWYAYPNHVYLFVNGERWFSALFTDTLGLLRIINWEKLPEAIGITLKNIHHPSDILQGPNARHNIFGLVYFGFYGSILFSYILGASLSFIRNILPYLVSNNFFGGGLFTYLMCRGAVIDTDPMLTITYFNNLIFIFPSLFIGYLFVKEMLTKKSNA